MSIISGFLENGLFRVRSLFVLLLSILVSPQVLAEKWYFDPSVSARLGYNDNLQLTTDSEIETYTSDITANAAFGVSTNVSDVSVSAKMVDRRFDDNSYLNTNNQFLNLQSSYRSGLNSFGLGAGYQRESTRTSEFDFSGYSNTNKIKITKSVSLYWDRTITERTSFRLGGSYTDVGYEDAENTGLSDYTYRSSYASIQHRLTEKTALKAVLSNSLYAADSTEYDTTSLQFGLDHMFSETFSVNLLLGPNYIKSKLSSISGDDKFSSVGKLINAGFKKEFDRTSFSGSLNTSESAGGEGRMTRRTSANLSMHHKLSARTTLSLSGSIQQNESGGGRTDASADRTYLNFEPKLSWKASPWWTVSGSYRYRESEYTSSDSGPAKSNAVYLSLEYVWPREPH